MGLDSHSKACWLVVYLVAASLQALIYNPLYVLTFASQTLNWIPFHCQLSGTFLVYPKYVVPFVGPCITLPTNKW